MKNIQTRLAWTGITLLAGSCLHLAAQEPTLSLVASSEHFQLGSGFATGGDLNGDGVLDIAIADRSGMIASLFGSGVVHIVSGTDGSTLRTYTGTPAASQSFGASLAALDANGDGIQDLAVGSPGQTGASGYGAGAVRVYSGADGALLWTSIGAGTGQLGASLANAGDQNGDGISDLYVGAPLANAYQGMVFVLSGSDGTVLRSIGTDVSTSAFGVTLAALDDMDGDGLDDLAVGAPGFRVGYNPAGRVLIVRSSDGMVAAQIAGVATYNRLGESLARTADVNGDGLADLLVGSYSGGTALVVSGADLDTIDDLSIPSLPLYRPLTVGGGLDFDGDGTQDWLIGSSGLGTSNGQLVGAVRIVSGSDHSTLFEKVAATPYTGLGDSLKVLDGFGFAAGEAYLLNPDTSGYGAAYLWEMVADSDGDGILDGDDAVPFSIMDATIFILGIDSGVPNSVDGRGVSVADRFLEIGQPADYPSGGSYYAQVVHLANGLKDAGLLSKDQAKAICNAARSGALHTP